MFNTDWGIDASRIDTIEETLESFGSTIYPEKNNRFRALKISPKQVKVVILGQDPYHDGSANGLAFASDKKTPPSLANIYHELVNTYGECDTWGDFHVNQGVLLLNTSLSVEKGKPGSHMHLWKNFTADILKRLNEEDNVVYLAWGKYAQEIIKEHITNPTAVIIKTTHPSPLSAKRASKDAPAFMGSECFKQVNDAVIAKGKTPVNW